MRKTIQLVTDNIYHVVSRGNGQQDIFFSNGDYLRFIQNIFVFNDKHSTEVAYRKFLARHSTNVSGSDPDTFGISRKQEHKKRKLLVEVLAFCLMPNHFHLLFRQLRHSGISEFVKKIKGGYASYINQKYERNGSLFQSHFKAVDVESDRQLNTLFAYIHTNPCQLVAPKWKTQGLYDKAQALAVLNSYRWSSYFDYIGKKNFPSVTKRNLFMELYTNPNGCRSVVEDWVLHKAEAYNNIKEIVLE